MTCAPRRVELAGETETNRTSGDEFEELLLEVADLGRDARFGLAMLLDALLPVSAIHAKHRQRLLLLRCQRGDALSLVFEKEKAPRDSHLLLGLFKHLAHLLLIRLGESLPVRDDRLEFEPAVVAPFLVKVGEQSGESLTVGWRAGNGTGSLTRVSESFE